MRDRLSAPPREGKPFVFAIHGLSFFLERVAACDCLFAKAKQSTAEAQRNAEKSGHACKIVL